MKSILIIGMGKFGRHLAERMQEFGNDVMIADANEEVVERLVPIFKDSHIGDCTDETVLRSLGINNFDICFVAIGENFQSSLVITALLKKLGARHVVAKADHDIQAELLKTIGADEVVYPDLDIVEKIAVKYNSDNVFDFIELTPEYAIYEIAVNPSWIGKTIADLGVRRKYLINIIAVKKDNILDAAPGADYTFSAGDHIIVIGKASDVIKMASKD